MTREFFYDRPQTFGERASKLVFIWYFLCYYFGKTYSCFQFSFQQEKRLNPTQRTCLLRMSGNLLLLTKSLSFTKEPLNNCWKVDEVQAIYILYGVENVIKGYLWDGVELLLCHSVCDKLFIIEGIWHTTFIVRSSYVCIHVYG